MSIKDLFNYCCLILAGIPLLGFLLYYFFGYKYLLGFCLAPTIDRSVYYYGDGALGVVAEIMVTISIEICLCIYCLIAFRHKIKDALFHHKHTSESGSHPNL